MISPQLRAIGMAAMGSLFLYLTGLFVFFSPLPFLLLSFKRGLREAVLSFVAAGCLLAALYLLPHTYLPFLPLGPLHPHFGFHQIAILSMIYFFYYALLGMSLGALSKTHLTMEKGIFVALAIGLFFPGLLLLLYAQGIGLDLLGSFRTSMTGLLLQMADLQEKGGAVNREGVVFLKEQAPTIVATVLSVFPALWINLSLMVMSLNILFLRRWMAKEGSFPGWPDFGLWRLQEGWIWATIAVGSLFFLNLYFAKIPLLGTVALNALLVLLVIYFFQGLAIVSYYFRRRFSPFMRMLSYFLILLFVQMFGIFIVALGLFDFWFDFRKLKKVA